MRKLCFVLCVLFLPLPAAAQQSFALPSIGLPLPSIGLRPHSVPWEPTPIPSWERRQLPQWEQNRIPPWERGHLPTQRIRDVRHPRNVIGPQVVYYYLPYPVAVVEQPPQVIVVQQPPPQVITVEVPAREPREEPAPAPREVEPPFVPSGDRTLYVIPGCYVGNVPPTNLKLPANCDLKKVTTFNP